MMPGPYTPVRMGLGPDDCLRSEEGRAFISVLMWRASPDLVVLQRLYRPTRLMIMT